MVLRRACLVAIASIQAIHAVHFNAEASRNQRKVEAEPEGLGDVTSSSCNWQPRLKIYFVNLDMSLTRRRCMRDQLAKAQMELAKVNIVVAYERFPAVELANCTSVESCMREKPECFSAGAGYIHHGLLDPNPSPGVIKGVLGNWCAHRFALEKMMSERGEYNYFMVFEDDVILLDNFVPSLVGLFNRFPHHWSLIAWDTFSHAKPGDNYSIEAQLFNDRFEDMGFGMSLYSLSAIKNSYWGAHAWLLNGFYLERFTAFFKSVPTVPLDWVTKAARPMHIGIWAYQANAVLQRQTLSMPQLLEAEPSCQGMTESLIGRRPEEVFVDAFSIHDDEELKVDAAEAAEEAATAAEAENEPDHEEDAAQIAALDSADGDDLDWPHLPLLRPVDERAFLLKGVAAPPPRQQVQRERPTEIFLFGQMGSGVKYFHELVARNLENPNNKTLCSNFDDTSPYCGGVWAHTNPHRVMEVAENIRPVAELNKGLAVVVVRHPFSFLRSVQKSSVDSARHISCAPTEESQGQLGSLSEPCMYREPDSSMPQRLKRAACMKADSDEGVAPPCWESLVKAWNGYMSGFRALGDSSLFARVVLVRYEDIVEHPRVAIGMLAQIFGLPVPDVIDVPRSPLGNNPNALSYAEALEKTRRPQYGSKFSCQEMSDICSNLNSSLLFRYGYHGCQPYWPGYDELIGTGEAYQVEYESIVGLLDEPERMNCGLEP